MPKDAYLKTLDTDKPNFNWRSVYAQDEMAILVADNGIGRIKSLTTTNAEWYNDETETYCALDDDEAFFCGKTLTLACGKEEHIIRGQGGVVTIGDFRKGIELAEHKARCATNGGSRDGSHTFFEGLSFENGSFRAQWGS